MTRIHQMILVTALTVVGVWGCARPAPPAAAADKLKQLESRVAKLENDLRSAMADRDAARTKLADAETEHRAQVAELQRQVQNWSARAADLEKERDEVQARLTARTTERDQVQTQFDTFRKSIKDLLGQTEATIAAPAIDQAPVVAGLKSPGF
jgi:predicted  nucleic acid-binding Zn-ribbon protein